MAALAANGNHSLAGLRDAAIISVMSDAMLRVSELCALVVEDVIFEPDGSGRLTIRFLEVRPGGQGSRAISRTPHREKNPEFGSIGPGSPPGPCFAGYAEGTSAGISHSRSPGSG